MSWQRWIAFGIVVLAALGVAAWFLVPRSTLRPTPGPPRAVETKLLLPPPSEISLPIILPLPDLEKALEKAVPTTLWMLDEQLQLCAPGARVKLFGQRLKVTPDLKCKVNGTVTRGRLQLVGSAGKLRLLLPVSGTLTASDIGGLGIAETATAQALVTADVTPDVTPDGHLSARIKLNYDWQQEPGVMLLGTRIRLTRQADQKLAPVIAKLERDLPQQLQAVALRKALQGLWQQGFTVQSINRKNPAAWLKITPRALGLGRIEATSTDLVVHASLTAVTLVVLGIEPRPELPTNLPLIGRTPPSEALYFHGQLLADYDTLVPPISKALAKVAAKGIQVPDYGRVKVRFGKPTLYGTDGSRLVLGIGLSARGPRQLLDTKGYVWMTARPESEPGSEKVRIRDLKFNAGRAGDQQFALLVAIMSTEAVALALESAIAQDFTGDYDKLMTKIDDVLNEVPIGDFRARIKLDGVEHGKIMALGQGLYMPVVAAGTAKVVYVGPNAPKPARLRKPPAKAAAPGSR